MERCFYLKEHFVMDYMVHHPKGEPTPTPFKHTRIYGGREGHCRGGTSHAKAAFGRPRAAVRLQLAAIEPRLGRSRQIFEIAIQFTNG